MYDWIEFHLIYYYLIKYEYCKIACFRRRIVVYESITSEEQKWAIGFIILNNVIWHGLYELPSNKLIEFDCRYWSVKFFWLCLYACKILVYVSFGWIEMTWTIN